MSPLQIEILLHYWVSDRDYRDGDFDAPAVQEAIDGFIGAGIFRNANDVEIFPSGKKIYFSFEALKIYIDAICAVPLPMLVKQWVLPND